MDDLLSEFLTETTESITTLDVELVNLEKNPNDKDILGNIFRLVHTIKGTCGFLGLPRLESLAHAGENVLGKFRDGELTVGAESVTLILNSIDRIKEILSFLEENETEPEGDDQDLIVPLNLTAEGKPIGGEEKKEEKPAKKPGIDIHTSEVKDITAADHGGPVLDDRGFPVAAEFLDEFMEVTGETKTEEELAAEMEALAGDDPAEAPAPAAEAPAPAAEAPAPAAEAPAPAAEAPKEEAKVPAVSPKPKKKDQLTKKKDKPKGEPSVAAQTIRVNVELLENLMTLVSELVLTRNQLLQMVRGKDDSEFTVPLQRLSHITSDLQEGVMKTRMQPIGNAWAKLPRIIRDLSLEMDKKIDLQMLGADTELDRQVLELIKDPLTHMVRNSADHGLETTEGRIEAGKPEIGTVTLNAFHEGGHILIEITDDGRGLNLEKIKAKAIANGLVSEAEADALGDQEIAQFVFKAGLSTAEKITSVSGRGVGMDVVRTNVEKIGGNVELKTFPGRGSTFTIKIPLTLAIVSALIVESSAEKFAIPQISVLELVRITENSEFCIESINEAPVLRLRDRLLPLVSLSDLIKKPKEVVEGEESVETFIVVSQVGSYTFGIIVDRVFDTEEIVVKPVAPILRHISMFSGNTILGDGSVIMILDPNGIASATGEGNAGPAETVSSTDSRSEDKTSMLIFRAGGENARMAVPLALVARLEEIDMGTTEHSYGMPVAQYRGQLMPLIGIDDKYVLPTEGRQPVLVFSDRDRTMGLVVDEILDIYEDHLKVELKVDADGLIGTAVIDGKATDVIDAGYYLTLAFGDWFGAGEGGGDESQGGGRILLVDDSAFFRNLLTPLLSVAGFNVISVESADRALVLREEGLMFDAIVSDIEMPGMNGFELATAIRGEARWKDVPMVALSSHATEKDFERGREVGFNDYVAKFDRDSLLKTLQQLVIITGGSDSEGQEGAA